MSPGDHDRFAEQFLADYESDVSLVCVWCDRSMTWSRRTHNSVSQSPIAIVDCNDNKVA